jgi:hypothetical protein
MFSFSPTDIANAIPLFKALSAEWQIVIVVGVSFAGGAAAGWFLTRAWDVRLLSILQAEIDGYRNHPSASDSVAIGQRLKAIENKSTDPQWKAELSQVRQDVEKVRKPAITYENFDERTASWAKTGEKPNYVHLLFRNEETGGIAPNAAAKLSWWDIGNTGQKPLFSVDGKWQKAQAGHTIDLLPNRASHGLDLFIHKPGEDWIYGLDNSVQPIIERHRLRRGTYTVTVTISCEGYSKDFWFRVVTGPIISVDTSCQMDKERKR